MKKDTKRIGDITTAKITASLLSKGYTILTPFGDNERYDLVLDINGKFERVQCKTGRQAKSGSLVFSTKSVSCNGQTVKGYQGEIEYFGVYYPINDKCYLIPIDKTGKGETTLQFIKSSMSRKEGKFASDFEI